MDPTHTVQRCKWAVPTLYLPLPDWLDAWNQPWSCRRDGPPRRLESTQECLDCRRWEARVDPEVTLAFAQFGR